MQQARSLKTPKKRKLSFEHVPRFWPGLSPILRPFHRRDARGRCAARALTSGLQRALPEFAGMTPRLRGARTCDRLNCAGL